MDGILQKKETILALLRSLPQRLGVYEKKGRQWNVYAKWLYIRIRRLRCACQNLWAGHHAVEPAVFLLVAAISGVAITLTTLYTPSYAVYVDGVELGVVADQAIVEDAVALVEAQGQRLFGYDYQVEGDISFQAGLALKTDLTDERDIETYFFTQMDEMGDALRKYQVVVSGTAVGITADQDALNALLEEIRNQYVNENTISSEFVEVITIEPVYTAQESEVLDIASLRGILTANTTGETTYTVAKGDTFNAIAFANDMSVSELRALNPNADINRLSIGQALNIKEEIPFLSVATMERLAYTEEIACPVEEVADPSMYIGDSKILVQGETGEALVEADVAYINGYEKERIILSTTTVSAPTTTTKAVGTMERPRTASTGNFRWPFSGRITSYFGGRYIFGSYSYHSGIDISGNYGASIVAADGGTVTFSGYKGSYGNLVIITHDNGTQTYYAHCSSLLVSSGTKVYQGQTIARVGSTGRSTGSHLHFEVRVNGTAVNPLSYLP